MVIGQSSYSYWKVTDIYADTGIVVLTNSVNGLNNTHFYFGGDVIFFAGD
jgi:hypothetical protein